MNSRAVTVHKRNKLTRIYNTMFYLKWLLQMFSIDSGERKISAKEIRCFIAKSAITALLILALDVYTFTYKINSVYPNINFSIMVTDAVQVVYDYFQYLIDIYYVFKYGRHISEEYYKQYEYFDSILDVTHYSEIKNRVGRMVGLFILIWGVTSAFDFYAWYKGYGWEIPLVFAPAYLFLLMKILTMLDLTAHVINIECRLRVIGDLVQDYYNLADNALAIHSKGVNKDCVWNKNWFYSDGCARSIEMRAKVHPLKNSLNSSFKEMKWLSRCYLLLSEQSSFVNNMFGARFTLNSLSLLLDMVRFLNIAAKVVIGAQKSYTAGYYPAVSSLLRVLSCASVLVGLVYHCERAYRQRDRISSITDHLLINKNPVPSLLCVLSCAPVLVGLVHHCEKAYRQRDRIKSITDHLLIKKNPEPSLRSSASELRDLVSSRPISFNMAHYFVLNNAFLSSMASIVVTYTIILLQTT